MSISGISSSDYLYELYKSLFGSRTDSSGSQSADSAFDAVFGNSTSDTSSSDLSSLIQALDANSLFSAQNSFFSQLIQDVQGSSSADAAGTTSSALTGSDSNPLKKDMDALGTALAAGNLTDARNIFSTVMQNMQNGPTTDSGTTGKTVTSVASSSGTKDSSNSLSGTLDTLSAALSSGDLSSAKSAFSDLLKGVQAAGTSGSASDAASNDSMSGLNRKRLLDMLANLASANTQVSTISTSA